jgi:NAD-dependent dihydropyrimidine dehydrogenase PreA subunit
MPGPLRSTFLNRRYVRIDAGRCVGCTLCVQACPNHGALAYDQQARKAYVKKRWLCAGCLKCASRCPNAAISIDTDTLGLPSS